MGRYLFSILIALLLNAKGFTQSYGLTFSSHEVVLEKRSSLDLSPDDSLCFAKDFALEFDINFLPNYVTYFGYVVRIISGDNQNIDLIYDQKSRLFKLITGEKFSGISVNIDSVQLCNTWNRFNLKLNLQSHSIQCYVNGKLYGSSSFNVSGNCFKFLWGANDYQKFKTRDVPPMQIKDIRISEGGRLKHFWPLDEDSGEVCYDRTGGLNAITKNALWIKPKHEHWQLAGSFTVGGYAATAFNAKNDVLYIAGSDSMALYSFKNEQSKVDWQALRHENLLMGSQAIYDSTTNKLYDFYIDQKKIAAYNFDKKEWDKDFVFYELTEFWHANKFISEADTSLYIIGGYGQLRYKNLVQRYHFETNKWDSVPVTGDYFPPRYLAAAGVDQTGNYAYLIGGYGSQTGDQMLDPRNYYDLFRYDVKNRAFKKMYSLKRMGTPFTFANSLIIGPDPGEFYGLTFANDCFNSSLHLIKGSLQDSEMQFVGDSIPYSFHDIESFADLYYSPLSKKLVAVTFLYSNNNAKEKNTQVKIYTLNFPPQPAAITDMPVKERNSLYLFVFIAVVAASVLYYFWFRRYFIKKKLPVIAPAANEDLPNNTAIPHFIDEPEKNHQPAIYLFGHFQVFDKEGNDITQLFTPLLKELFLIIVIYSFKDGSGISSEALNEMLWNDKSVKDAKNNRSVNIAKLKAILEKVGDCGINKESGYWQFQIPDPDIYVDYKKYIALLQHPHERGKAYINDLLDIIKRGSFLFQTEYGWLDNTKSEVSNAVIDICLHFIKTQTIAKDPEFIIKITHCIFNFDQLNEDALTYKCKSLIWLKRHTLANNTYLKFTKDYKDIYGEDFGKSFHEVII